MIRFCLQAERILTIIVHFLIWRLTLFAVQNTEFEIHWSLEKNELQILPIYLLLLKSEDLFLYFIVKDFFQAFFKSVDVKETNTLG